MARTQMPTEFLDGTATPFIVEESLIRNLFDSLQNVVPDPRESCGPYEPIEANDVERDMEFSSENHDTIGMIILDRNGKLVAGTSTNGARFKIPG